MYFLLKTRRGIILIFLIFFLCGCGATYNRTEMIEGTYYPNGEVILFVFLGESCIGSQIKVNQSINFHELGDYEKNFFCMEHNKSKYKVVKAKLPHPRHTDFFYIPISELLSTGRFEYHVRSLTFGEWIEFHPFWSILIAIIFLIGIFNVAKVQNAILLRKQRLDEEKKLQELQKEQLRKEIEIQCRKDIVLDVLNNQYKETEREVNKTLIPTLINELYDIYIGLHSDNMNEIITDIGTDFYDIINAIKLELNRLKNLALSAQTKGFTDSDNEEYRYSTEVESEKMTKEKAFKIFEIDSNATKDDIKKAYRKLVKKYNSDQRTHYEDHIKEMLEDKMKELNNAKDYLLKLGLI